MSAQIIQQKYKNIDNELTESIINECDRVNQLINSFQLNLSDLSTKNNKINIHEPLRYVLKKINLKKHKNISIIEQFDPSLPEVEFEKNNLIMIFENLLNKIKNDLIKILINLTIIESSNESPPKEKKIIINPKYIGKKMSRNEPCYCGSNKKYKHCCGRF